MTTIPIVLPEQVIAQTKKWIVEVVVGCKFCPFAAKEVKNDTIYYAVETSNSLQKCLETFMRECERLTNEPEIATSFMIFQNAFQKFASFLDLVEMAETLLEDNGLEGVYQVASFHPDYLFAKAKATDAANYTNRSIYPMLHLLREEQIEKVLEQYPNPENIPDRNVDFAREKGLAYMQMLRNACL